MGMPHAGTTAGLASRMPDRRDNLPELIRKVLHTARDHLPDYKASKDSRLHIYLDVISADPTLIYYLTHHKKGCHVESESLRL
jgi:hypothetical protein